MIVRRQDRDDIKKDRIEIIARQTRYVEMIAGLTGYRCFAVLTGWICLTRWIWLHLTGTGWTWLDLTGSGWTWLDLAGPGETWLDLAGSGWI